MTARLSLLPALLLATACGGGGSDDVEFPIDAPPDAPPPLVDAPIDAPPPTGPDVTYVVSALNLPSNATEAQQLGLDIDGRPNDGIDNQLGMVLGSLDTLAPDLSSQAASDLGIARGDVILLAHAEGMIAGGPLALRTYGGASPNPPACNGAGDTVCGRHLTGGASFTIDGAVVSPAPIVGAVTASPGPRFLGEGGRILVPVRFFTGTAWLTLERAKADLTTLSPTSLSGKLGGGITQDEMSTVLVPAVADGIRAEFAAACDVGGVPPGCGCTPGSSAETLRGLFDKQPTDCMITDAEVDDVLSGFLTPDLDLTGDGVPDAISLGVGITAVAAAFTPPP